MNIIQLAANIEKMRRDLEAPWIQNAIAQAATAFDTFTASIGGAENVRRMIEEQERIVREVAGHYREYERIARLAEEQANVDSLHRHRYAFDVPYIAPRLEHTSRRFRREIQSEGTVPERTIVRREVKRRIGFL